MKQITGHWTSSGELFKQIQQPNIPRGDEQWTQAQVQYRSSSLARLKGLHWHVVEVMKVDYDIYTEQGVEDQFDEDNLTAEEMGFMLGYIQSA